MRIRRHHSFPCSIQGFNLTEMALVMGIAGLIIGGMWSLLTQYRDNTHHVQLTDELFTIARNVRAAYVGKVAVESDRPVDMMPILLGNAGARRTDVFPEDFVDAALTMHSPWLPSVHPIDATFLHQIYVCGWTNVAAAMQTCNFINAATTNLQLFAVEIVVPTDTDCIKASLRNSGNAIPGLVDVLINGASMVVNNNVLPITMAFAQAQCVGFGGTAGAPNIIDFVYKITP